MSTTEGKATARLGRRLRLGISFGMLLAVGCTEEKKTEAPPLSETTPAPKLEAVKKVPTVKSDPEKVFDPRERLKSKSSG